MIQIDARNITWDLGKDVTYEILIANLGGYESAKSKLRDNGSLHAERLKKALLEYRCQHNIFDAGDKVILDGKDDLFTLDYFMNIGNGWVSKCGYRFSRQLIERHATDEEIKAGKRLEVNS
ncbi:hypothetical protein ACVCFZ_05370 [Acinetobacter variabilis]